MMNIFKTLFNRKNNFFQENRWAILSGVLIGTSYIPSWPWALFFAYVPLWLSVVKAENLKKAFIQGWWTQFTLTLIGFHWIAYTTHEFGQMPWIVAIPTLIIFCSLIHIYIPLSITLVVFLQKKLQLRPTSTFFLFPILLVLFEKYWPSIFPWNLGYPLLWAHWPIFQWADIIGFQGLSFLVLCANAFVAWLYFKHKNKIWDLALGLTSLIVVLILLNWTGSIHGKIWKTTDDEIQVLVTQANIGNFEKMFAERGRGFQNDILNQFTNLTQSGLSQHPNTNLIIWPETAFPDYLDETYKTKERPRLLKQTIQKWKTPLLTGSFSKDPTITDPNKNTFNAVFLLDARGERAAPAYKKTQLLAFGEYLPFSEYFPILLKWVPVVSNFGRGQGPTTLPLPWKNQSELKIGTQICYEGLDPHFTRSLALQGADLLVNVTNDSWFGYPFEPRQHLTMTLARSIEVRRPLVRSTNTGITTASLADGTWLSWSPLLEPWVGGFHIPFQKQAATTVFTNYGHLDIYFYILLLIVTLLMAIRQREKK